MRLVVLCPHFEPDVAPTGVVITAIVEQLAERGHEVHVITALPWYLQHAVEPGWDGQLLRTERRSWGSVTRVHPFPTDKRNIPARAAAFGGFTALATAVGLLGRQRLDGVLAMSPPLTLGPAGILVARRFHCPLVLNIQDVFPDVAIEVGALANPAAIAVARRLEAWCYRHASAVTVLSRDLAANVEAKLPPDRRLGPGGGPRVRVIPNFVDTGRLRPAPHDNSYRRSLGLEGRRLVAYAGNLGFSQSVELLVEAARAFRDDPGVGFVVNGAGSRRQELETLAAGLSNIVFVGLQPADRLNEVLAAADIHTVLLRSGLARASVPSKLYSILAAGRPVLASVDPGTEVDRVLAEAGAGRSVSPDDPGAFIGALHELLAPETDLEAMGRRGRAFVEEWVSPAGVAGAYAALFEELRDATSSGRRPLRW